MRRTTILMALLTLPSIVAAQSPVVYRIPVNGVIENGLAPFVARALKEAHAANASAAILDLDTPGGRVDAAERIVDAVRRSPVPVYAFVNPRAFSAGAMIALAAEGIYMTPGGVLGAATPVDGQGTKASEKIVSAMRAEFRALAEARGLDPKLAEGMVDETIDIPGVKPAGKLLTLSTSEAIELGFARGEAVDLGTVLYAVGVGEATVVSISPNWAEQIVRFLTHPVVSPLLLSLGMLGLLFEIKAGAFGLGGLISLASLGLFFGSSMLLGLAGWEEVLLLGLGLIALGLEVFVLPGFGVAGILGIVLISASMLLALVGNTPTVADFLQAGAVLAASLVVTGAVLFGWLRHLPNSERWGGLFLKTSSNVGEGFISAPPRPELVGTAGVATTDLRPSGTATFDGERMDVVTEGEFVKAGTGVTIVRSDGYRHVVRATTT
jgi:membrane-bound serine protease (ClpP class)